MGLTGERGALAIVDRATGYTDCFPAMSKSADDAHGAILEFFGPQLSKAKLIHTDMAPEMINAVSRMGVPHSQSIQRRLAGVRAALAQSGLEPVSQQLGKTHDFAQSYDLASRALANRPTGLIGLTDIAAIGAIHAAHDLGLRIPHDLSIIGFDNIPSAAFVLPRLTTIAQPIRHLGRSAAEMLHRLIIGEPQTLAQALPALTLIQRDTTAPPCAA
jgi:DNA-binding LacI/PurR family transcriptional regulator